MNNLLKWMPAGWGSCLSVAFLTVGLSAGVQAQNVEFEARNFAGNKDAFKLAAKELKEGDKLYEQGPNLYEAAIPHYLLAYQLNPNNAQLNYRLGTAYLGSAFKTKALPYLEAAEKLNPRIDPLLPYNLGRALHLNAKWDQAREAYQQAIPAAQDRNSTVSVTDVRKRMDECQTGKELMAKPVRAFIDNLGPEVNSQYAEYCPVITADESQIFFTSRRATTIGGKMDPDLGDYFEDIYFATQTDGGKWSVAKNLGKPLNSEGHDATVGISPDGQKLLTYLQNNAGDIYECTLEGAVWSAPEPLSRKINTGEHESSASYAPDGNSLFFVSNKEDGGTQGMHDIYQIGLNTGKGKGKAQEAVNLGPTINTRYNEEAVFMHPDGKTMYFSSEGHNTMGGYDIFKSVYEKGKWSVPENLGWPINTPDDDVFFVLSASGRHGYYSSARPDGLGSRDIYRITFLGPEKPPMLNTEDNLLASRAAPVREANMAAAVAVSSAQVTILKGVVSDASTKKPLEAEIEVIDNTRNEVIAAFKSNSITGRYLVSLPSGINYGIVVRKEGYLFHSENFDIPASSSFQEIVKNVELNKLAVGNKIVLRNIFFDFDKATLKPESRSELERVYKLMSEEVPNLKIELSGHTDDRGNAAYNQDLSERRAKAVVEYLTKKGIAADRFKTAGYGLTQPMVPNTNAANRQLNRRTEFKILSLQ
ncbi:MAG: PD40 domain-containing protein [Hymenobacteraceae bacterium]|nr:PD40 domain-containing protein [Hymenobacteraceae bacterium]